MMLLHKLWIFVSSRKEKNLVLVMLSTCAERFCGSPSWWWTATSSTDLEMWMHFRYGGFFPEFYLFFLKMRRRRRISGRAYIGCTNCCSIVEKRGGSESLAALHEILLLPEFIRFDRCMSWCQELCLTSHPLLLTVK